jgi:hypothetical protein
MTQRTKSLLKVALIASLFIGVSAFAGDYQGLDDANELMDTTQSTVSKGIGLAGFAFGWILLLGFPFGGYYLGYKHFKEKDEQDRSGNTNNAMIHVKAGAIALVALIMGTMLFTFIFVKTLNVKSTTGDAIKTVLKIDKAFE